jgi:hypothetical protein
MTATKRNIGRNDLCLCGSGLKYKRCCMNKNQKTEIKPQFKLSDILGLVQFGLQELDIFTDDQRKVNVKKIGLLGNNTLECQIYPYNPNSIDIKLEIGTIMRFLHGFFKDGIFLDTIDTKYFAVRAFDYDNKEIMYAISSYETAGMVSNGNSIDWLKSTIFQENTADYRLGIAKRQISEIENSLRYVIVDILSHKHKYDWWDNSVGDKLSNSVKKMYQEQFNEIVNDGAILIKYSFLSHLKKIICTNWKDFKHLFDSKITFENNLDELNNIRREESHNREISDSFLERINLIYNFLLKNIASIYPKLIPEYLVDNWRLNIKQIMSNKYLPLFDEDITEEKDLLKKFLKSTLSINHLIDYLQKTEDKLSSLIVPIQKKNIHDKLVKTFIDYRHLQENLIEFSKIGDIEKLENTLEEIKNYKKIMDSFTIEFLLSEG